MGVNEVPSQLQRLRTQGRMHEDGNWAVSHGVNGLQLSCLKERANVVFVVVFFCKMADGWGYPVLCCSLCYLSFLYIRELCVQLRGVLLFTLHALYLRVCSRDQGRLIVSGDRSLGTWQLLICTDWAKIAEERHGLNVRLQTKSYDCSEERRPYEYTYNESIQPSFTECNFYGWKTTRDICKNCAPIIMWHSCDFAMKRHTTDKMAQLKDSVASFTLSGDDSLWLETLLFTTGGRFVRRVPLYRTTSS